MGCDIHICFEKKKDDGTYEMVPNVFEVFDCRDYSIFAFLAGVRNYSKITPIVEQRGFPEDASPETLSCFDQMNDHSPSYLTIAELQSFDYDQEIEDRRCSEEMSPNFINCGATAPIGEGKKTTYREFLGEWFFVQIDKMEMLGYDRMVFWFDC